MTQESPDVTPDVESAPLLARLGDAFEADLEPIPADVIEAARSAFTWRLGDAELAELLFDSASEELAGVRGHTMDRRSFRFGSGDFVVRIHLTEASLVLMIEPPLSVACRVVTGEGASEHVTDDLGELVVDAPDFPFRVEVELPAGTTVTPWITG
jgi:hypothetical protein